MRDACARANAMLNEILQRARAAGPSDQSWGGLVEMAQQTVTMAHADLENAERSAALAATRLERTEQAHRTEGTEGAERVVVAPPPRQAPRRARPVRAAVMDPEGYDQRPDPLRHGPPPSWSTR